MDPVTIPEAIGPLILHAGSHSSASTPAFDWRYAAASMVLVGGVGGLLYWYFSRAVQSRPGQSRKQ